MHRWNALPSRLFSQHLEVPLNFEGVQLGSLLRQPHQQKQIQSPSHGHLSLMRRCNRFGTGNCPWLTRGMTFERQVP
uniref:Uncharacterized protein n=1 Tax=Physcomitrium patens TaxID=3218 RepID=A0A7I4DJL7_PHYPA